MPRVVVALAVAFAFAIGHGVNDDGEGHERYSAKEKEGIGCRADEIARNGTDYKSEADSDGECNGKSGDIDGSDQKQIGDVEDSAAADGPEYARGRCRYHGCEERGTGVSSGSGRKPERDGSDEKADERSPNRRAGSGISGKA